MIKTSALVFLAVALPTSALASNLSDAQIRETIAGKQVTLSTSMGSFPLRYGANNTVTGDGSATGLARFYNPKETGKWWVKNDQLCQKFPTWYKGRSLCFRLTKLGAKKLKWVREDGYSGTARIR